MANIDLKGLQHTSGGTISINNNIETSIGTSSMPVGTVVNVTTIQDNVRASVPGAAVGTLFGGSFTKKRSDSIIFVKAVSLGNGSASGNCGVCIRVDGIEDFGSGYQYDDSYGAQVRQIIQSAQFAGLSAGSHTVESGWRAINGSSGEHPFQRKNPNASDDSRLNQTVSTIVVYEVVVG